MRFQHNSEVIKTLFISVKELRNEVNQNNVDIKKYDKQLTVMMYLAEPLMMNDLNMMDFIQLGGMELICSIVLEQPVPSEIKNF